MSTRPGTGLLASLRILGERNLGLFFSGYVVSLIGSQMVPVALSFAVLNEGHGAAAVGWVLGVETVPLVVLLLIGGAVADRLSRRVIMLGADLLRFASEGLLAGLILTGHPPLWVFMVLAGALGAGQAFFNPAMTGLLPELVARDSLQQANAMRGIATSTGSVLGPSIAGVIVAAGGAGWAIAIDAVTYLISAACLRLMVVPPKATVASSTLLSQMAAGWREFRSRTWVWAIVLQFATFNALSFAPLMVLGAVVSRDRLGGASAWGAILAMEGVGAILGGIVAVRMRARRPLITATVGAMLFSLPTALIAIPAPTAMIAAGAGIAGIGLSIFGVLWDTALQQHVPDEVLSRVSAYDWSGSVVFVPVGYIIAGPLASLIGTSTVLWLAAVWAFASCVAVLCSRSVRELRSGQTPNISIAEP